MSDKNITPAINRLFRSYLEYTQDTSEDTLFLLLTALHSLDDRLKPVHGRLFFEIPEYVTLKALRNHFHHGGELNYVLRVKALGKNFLPVDLLHACLISTVDCVAAIEGAKEKYRNGVLQAFADTTKVYGEVADINPCIFNGIVKIYETLNNLGLAGENAAYEQFEIAYDLETKNGFSHYVTGGVQTHAANAHLVSKKMASLYSNDV